MKDSTDKFEKKIEKLEKIALDNKTELESLSKKIDEVIAHQLNIKPVDVDALGHQIDLLRPKNFQKWTPFLSLLLLI